MTTALTADSSVANDDGSSSPWVTLLEIAPRTDCEEISRLLDPLQPGGNQNAELGTLFKPVEAGEALKARWVSVGTSTISGQRIQVWCCYSLYGWLGQVVSCDQFEHRGTRLKLVGTDDGDLVAVYQAATNEPPFIANCLFAIVDSIGPRIFQFCLGKPGAEPSKITVERASEHGYTDGSTITVAEAEDLGLEYVLVIKP